MAESFPKPAHVRSNVEVARGQVSAALALLDTVGAPSDIGAHLSMAIDRMDRELNRLPVNNIHRIGGNIGC